MPTFKDWVAGRTAEAGGDIVDADEFYLRDDSGDVSKRVTYSGLKTALASQFASAFVGPQSSKGSSVKAFDRLTEAGVIQLKWCSLGDSMATRKMRYMYQPLSRAYGGGTETGASILDGFSGTGYGVPGVSTLASTGTVTNRTGDTDVWFTGLTQEFATAATRTYGYIGQNPYADIVKVYYLKGTASPDGGTFRVNIAGSDESGTIDTNTAVGLGVVTIDMGTVARREIEVECITGPVRIVGIEFYNSDQPGVVHGGPSVGGLDVNEAVSNATTVATLQTYLESFDPDVITFESKQAGQGVVDWDTNSSTLFAALRASCPTATIIVIGSTPVATGDDVQVQDNAIIRAAAVANGCDYWDGYSQFGSYAALAALGWEGDGTHPAEDCNAFLGAMLLRDFGFLEQTGVATVVDQATVTDRLYLGLPASDGSDPKGQIVVPASPAVPDVYLYLRRQLDVVDAADEVFDSFSWRMRPIGNNDQQIPAGVRVGDVGPYLQSQESGVQLRVSSNRVTASLCDINARTFISGVASSSVSGAVTAALNAAAGVFVFTLTGNVTSFDITDHPASSGQEVEIHFVQDGTGSRTLSGVDASLKWAGAAAPTLTTTAGRRDIFRFRQISGTFYEVSRAMNVG